MNARPSLETTPHGRREPGGRGRAAARLGLLLLLAGCSDAVEDLDAGTAAPDATALDAEAAPDARPAGDAAPTDEDAALIDAASPDARAPDAAAQDAGLADAAADAATRPDAGHAGPCAVVASASGSLAGQVGANGGAPSAALECPPGEVMIGAAVRMSDGPTTNGNQRSAYGFAGICAQVTTSSSGVSVGPERIIERTGDGRFGWTPATLSALTRCAPGSVLSGLAASRGASGDRFIDVTIRCSELDPRGVVTGATQSIYVMGSLSEGVASDSVECPTGEIVQRMDTRTGAGFDALVVFCAPPSCDP